MANTFTTNYNLIKSEVGGDNQTWGDNLHTTLTAVDLALSKLMEDQIVTGITSAAIDITASGDNGIISTSSNYKYFESLVIGDKVRVSGSSQAINGTAAVPAIHTIISKTSADSITVSSNLVTDTSSTITVAKVFEPVHINSGPIICAPLTSLTGGATRTAGGSGLEGTDATDALKANGDVTLGGDVDTDTTTMGSKVVGDVLPQTDGTYDLGSSTYEWQDLHVDGTANIDSLVADTAAISAGTISGITSLSVSSTSITITGTSGGYSNFAVGSNGVGARTFSTGEPTGGNDGDIHYEYA